MIIIWLLGGIAAVTLAFFIPPNSTDLWPSLNAAAIPVILYIVALALYTLRSPISRKSRITAWVAIVLVGGATSVHWTGMETTTHWQHDQLLRIQSVIVRGILLARAPRIELDALEAYYKQPSKKHESLVRVFQNRNGGATVGTNIYKPESPEDSTSIVVESLSDDKIVLLGLHAFAGGRNPDFKNYDGRVGKIQERFTLTEKGITYDSEN